MARFCPICGTAVEATAPPPPPPGVIAPPPPPPPPSPYPAAQGYPQPAYGYAQPTRTNGMAIAAMVLGILWLYWIGSVLALIFGYIAKSQIDRSGGTQGGRGMAIAGIVLGWVGVGLLVLTVIVVASEPSAFE